jgi:hypothetical protein
MERRLLNNDDIAAGLADLNGWKVKKDKLSKKYASQISPRVWLL